MVCCKGMSAECALADIETCGIAYGLFSDGGGDFSGEFFWNFELRLEHLVEIAKSF
jgi:hypothetical protein